VINNLTIHCIYCLAEKLQTSATIILINSKTSNLVQVVLGKVYQYLLLLFQRFITVNGFV